MEAIQPVAEPKDGPGEATAESGPDAVPTDFQGLLREALTQALVDGEFNERVFFGNWFRGAGTIYLVLFRKNLAVTNVQYAELMSLLEMHSSTPDGDQPLTSQLVDSKQFRSFVAGLFETFLPAPEPKAGSELAENNSPEAVAARERAVNFVVEKYGQMICGMIVIQAFHGSALIMVPATLAVDIETICSESGYIFAAGRSIFARNLRKAKPKELISAISAHLRRYPSQAKTSGKLRFVAYAHEDFSPHDRRRAGELRNGLDDVKIHVEKVYVGGLRLPDLMDELRHKFDDDLVLSGPDNAEDAGQLRPQVGRSFWLIVDRSTDGHSSVPGTDRYLICYDQLIVNANPLYLFDENKPAWNSHTTMPHTLVGGLINASRARWPQTSPIHVGDPFAGTGTTLLEASRHPGVVASGSDCNDFAPLLLQDNVGFFAKNADELGEIRSELRALARDASRFAETADGEHIPAVSNPTSPLDNAFQQAAGLVRAAEAGERPDHELATELANSTRTTRMIFYVLQRVIKRHVVALKRKSELFIDALRIEIDKLVDSIDDLVRVVRAEPLGNAGAISLVSSGSHLSVAGTLAISYFESLRDWSQDALTNADAMTWSGEYDLILTDPPYGVNTDDDSYYLAELYAQSLDRIVKSIRNRGQLILSLADRIHTGRTSAFYTHKEFIQRQLMDIAARHDKVLVAPQSGFRSSIPLFRPPYYWESERALRRAILHFEVRDLHANAAEQEL